jgi:hypothetical protein
MPERHPDGPTPQLIIRSPVFLSFSRVNEHPDVAYEKSKPKKFKSGKSSNMKNVQI